MTYQVGDRVQMAASPVTVFEVLAVGVDDDPDRLLIQAVSNAPGRYPFSLRAEDLLPAE